MTALTFGYFLMTLIVIAFFINFYNFQHRTKRQLQQLNIDKYDLTERLKQEQRARENGQAMIHSQSYVISEAEDRIHRLEAKLSDLELLADRLEALSDRYKKLDQSWPQGDDE